MPISQSGLKWLWLSAVMLLADQVTKMWVQSSMALYDSIDILPIFNLTYVHNYGAAFSFLSQAGGWQRWLFTGIAAFVSILLLYWLRHNAAKHKLLNIAYCLVLAGAIGNVWDRVHLGYVVDFLHFHYNDWHYPAFNVADIAICLGAALLVWDAITHKQKVSHE